MKMASHMHTVTKFGILLCIIMLVALASGSMSRPPRNNDINNMADALRYLQDLDTYYGDKARVRFGKRGPLLLRDRLMEEADLIHKGITASEDEPF